MDSIKKALGSQIIKDNTVNFQFEVLEDQDPPMAKITGLKGEEEIAPERLSYSNKPFLQSGGTWADGKKPHIVDGKIVDGNTTFFPPDKTRDVCLKIKTELLVKEFTKKHGRQPTSSELLEKRNEAIETVNSGIPYIECVPCLTEYSHGTAQIPFFTTDRKLNFLQARAIIAAKLNISNPQGIKDPETGEYRPYNADDVEKYCKEHNMILHEEGDCRTINKIDEDLHNFSILRHRGGFSNNKGRVNDMLGFNDNIAANQNNQTNAGNGGMNKGDDGINDY